MFDVGSSYCRTLRCRQSAVVCRPPRMDSISLWLVSSYSRHWHFIGMVTAQSCPWKGNLWNTVLFLTVMTNVWQGDPCINIEYWFGDSNYQNSDERTDKYQTGSSKTYDILCLWCFLRYCSWKVRKILHCIKQKINAILSVLTNQTLVIFVPWEQTYFGWDQNWCKIVSE